MWALPLQLSLRMTSGATIAGMTRLATRKNSFLCPIGAWSHRSWSRRRSVNLASSFRIDVDVQVFAVLAVEEPEHHLVEGLGAVADFGIRVGIPGIEWRIVKMGDDFDPSSFREFLRPRVPAVVLLPGIAVVRNRE